MFFIQGWTEKDFDNYILIDMLPIYSVQYTAQSTPFINGLIMVGIKFVMELKRIVL
jgi:hypothetical protein